MKSSSINAVMWFRRDLRIEDNHALFRVLTECRSVLPLFLFDSHILSRLPEDDARVTFLWDTVSDLRDALKEKGSDLLTISGEPENVFVELYEQYGSFDIYANEDYEPYARTRDQKIAQIATQNGCAFYTYKDHVIHGPDEVLKSDGTPYTVYTPYSKKALHVAQESASYGSYDITRTLRKGLCDLEVSQALPSLRSMGFVRRAVGVRPVVCDEAFMAHYSETRDYPWQEQGTSQLGPHLRFGTVSVRALARAAADSADNTFLKELLWRDFFQAILYHYPQTPTTAFRVRYDQIPWRTGTQADKDFARWCCGETGYPLVDAGMRELNHTGYMHNRVRMVVASFLCKHLLLDWRRGERYFATKLMDYELASNVGNWQWAMGGGCDAAPYFRIFNPMTQHQKFDLKSVYVKKWIPEYNTDTYCAPLVEHVFARQRALAVYKKALQ